MALALQFHNEPESELSIPLGRDIETQEPFSITTGERKQGMIVVGATGSGKTTLITQIACHVINMGESLVYISPEDDGFNALLPLLDEKRMRNVALLDFTGGNRFAVLNPLAASDEGMTLSIFKKLWEIGPQTPYLENTLKAVIHIARRCGLTLWEIPELLRSKQLRDRCLEKIPRTLETSWLAWFWEVDWTGHSEQFRRERSDTIFNKIEQLLISPVVSPCISQEGRTSVDFRKIIEEKRVLFLKLSPSQLGGPENVRFLINFLLAELKTAIFSFADREPYERTVCTFLCDEWQRFLTPDFEDLLLQGRKFGFAPALASQVLPDRESGLQQIVEQVVNKVGFRQGLSDAKTFAWSVAKEPPVEYEEKERKEVVTKPLHWYVLSGRSYPREHEAVMQIFKEYEEEARQSNATIREGGSSGGKVIEGRRGTIIRSGFSSSWSNKGQVEQAKDIVEAVNGFLYQVMVRKPGELRPVAPAAMILYLAQKKQLPCYEYPPRYAYPRDYCSWFAGDTIPEEMQKAYAFLFLAGSMQELQQAAFPAYGLAVRNALKQVWNIEDGEIDRIINKCKPSFENLILEVRRMCDALEAFPIMDRSGVQEKVEARPRQIYDVVNDVTLKLVGLRNATAYVCLGARGEQGKAVIETFPLTPIPAHEEKRLQSLRRKQAEENGAAYTTAREDIVRNIQKRRIRLSLPPVALWGETIEKKHEPEIEKPPGHIQNEQPQKIVPNERREKKEAAQRKPAPPVPAISALTFEENYLVLLHRWYYLNLDHLTRLLCKKPTDRNHMRERINKLIDAGWVATSEWKEAGKPGKAEKVYSLTDAGVKQAQAEYGVKPSGSRAMALTQHTLLVNDALITLCLLPKVAQGITLTGLLHERYFKANSIKLANGGGLEPDGLVRFSLPAGPLALYVEMDLGHEQREYWQQEKMRKYLLALERGLLGTDRLAIAVCQPGGSIKSLMKWTEEVLENQRDYGQVFYLTDKSPLALTPLEFTTGAHWHQPFSTTATALIQIVKMLQIDMHTRL